MLKVLTVVGARPQFIKASALSRVIREEYKGRIEETLFHTGQHYDYGMSEIFFKELGLPAPQINANVGSGSHGEQTAEMIREVEKYCFTLRPDVVLVYGDTNSTLSAAIAASKCNINIVHVEAGLRSFDRSMPEEINRVLTDHVSSILCSPSQTGIDNLKKEGIFEHQDKATADNPMALITGDVMYDNALHFTQTNSGAQPWKDELGDYILCTVHRPVNTDNAEKLKSILSALGELSKHSGLKVLLPLHPRTSKAIDVVGISIDDLELSGIHCIEPLGYLEMLQVEKESTMVITDSGGVQKEAFFFKKPCLVLRDRTEWVEIINSGSAKLVSADESLILGYGMDYLNSMPDEFPQLYGGGKAGQMICEAMLNYL